MITTVNLNPCIDKSLFVENFKCGMLNRIEKARQDVSGKGINVAMVLKELGAQAECLGFNYCDDGNKLTSALEREQIPYDFVNVKGTLRTNTKILDTRNNVFTELNEFGGKVAKEDICLLKKKIRKHAEKSELIVISGSVPKGVPMDIYKEIIEDLHSLDVKIILDAEKELLTEGIKGKPYLIKPNIFELETAYGIKCKTRKDVIPLILNIIKEGVKIVCVSLGAEGAYISDGYRLYYSPCLELKVKGYQGAGDSMVAGLCKAIEENRDIDEMLKYGMAAAAASLVMEGTQLCKKSNFEKYLEEINVQQEEMSICHM